MVSLALLIIQFFLPLMSDIFYVKYRHLYYMYVHIHRLDACAFVYSLVYAVRHNNHIGYYGVHL